MNDMKFKVGDLVVCYNGNDNTFAFGTDIHKIIRIESRGEGQGYNYYFEDSPEIAHRFHTIELWLAHINNLYGYKKSLDDEMISIDNKLQKLTDRKNSIIDTQNDISNAILAITDNLMKLSLSRFPKINELLKKRDV